MTTTAQTHIPLNQLVAWPGNVRKTRNKTILAEVKASIKEDGLLQNLIVLPHGKKFAVAAGETRMLAMRELVAEGHLPEDFAVRVEFTTEENAHAVSLAENTIRENMNAADEAEAFAVLVKAGYSKLKIGERYGRTERYVEQRLKIAERSKASLKAYRDGLISLDQLHALTVAKSRKDEEAVLKQILGKGYFDRSPGGIREALKGDNAVELDDIRLKAVPPDDYVAAGGVIVKRDLWSGEDNGEIENVLLLNKLVDKKLAGWDEAVKEEGWLWTETRVNFGYSDRAQFTALKPDFKPLPAKKQTKLEELRVKLAEEEEVFHEMDGDDPEVDNCREAVKKLEDQIEKLEDEREQFWSPEKLAIAGAVVYIGEKGIAVERGLVKPEQKSAAKKLQAAADGEDGDAGKAAKKAKPEFRPGLIQELTAQRSAAMTAALMVRPKEAHLALYFSLIEQVFYDARSSESALQIGVHQKFFDDVKGYKAVSEIEAQHKALMKKLPTKAKLWDWVLKADTKKLAEIVAFCVAVSLDATQTRNDNPKDKRFASAANIAETVKFDMKKYYTPKAKDYFSRVSREQVCAALKDVDATMPSGTVKKADLDKYAEQQVAGKGWLPKPLR